MKAVIGMNYGDEGKGHIVNYFSGPNTLVVRHNGGAQAGHAVNTEGGAHVFHHFGAGTLRGARTLLARRFILNPLVFVKELNELLGKVNMREILIDPRCIVTTPYDMMINRYNSFIHSANDTVGMGINETVERSTYDQLAITARDIKERPESYMLAKMAQLENEWIPFRLQQLKIPIDPFREWGAKLLTSNTEKSFIEYAKWMLDHSVLWEDANTIDRYLAKAPGRNVVFEGAQGMLLDQRRTVFAPYLTRSNTGYRNVKFIIKDMHTDIEIEPVLVTRCYLTRHGDGPMLNEDEPYLGLGDATNPHNEWQGSMRFGTLDANWYDEAIEEVRNESGRPPVVAMTCTDHSNGKIKFWNGDDKDVTDMESVAYISRGPTSADVVDVSEKVKI